MPLSNFGWSDSPTTPLSAAELEAFGQHIGTYVDSRAPGIGGNPRGTYNSGTTYAANDTVLGSNGHWYISLGNGNVGHDPTTDGGVHWADLLPTSVVSATNGVDKSSWTPAVKLAVTKEAPVNPLHPDFGAKGDGSVTNEDVAINAAITFAKTASQNGGVGELYLPDGYYKTSARLALGNCTGLKIKGGSRWGTIIEQQTSNEPIAEASATGFVESWTLENLRLQYSSQQNAASHPNSTAVRLRNTNSNGFAGGVLRNLRVDKAVNVIQWGDTATHAFWNNNLDLIYCTNIVGSLIKNSNPAPVGSPTNRVNRLTHIGGSATTTGVALDLEAGGEWVFESLDIEDWTNTLLIATGGSVLTINGWHLERIHFTDAGNNGNFIYLNSTEFDVRGFTMSVLFDGTSAPFAHLFNVNTSSQGYIGSSNVLGYGSGNGGTGGTLAHHVTDSTSSLSLGPRKISQGAVGTIADSEVFESSIGLVADAMTGGPPVWDSSVALPTPSASNRGRLIWVKGTNGTTADQLVQCLQSATGTFSWTSVVATGSTAPSGGAAGQKVVVRSDGTIGYIDDLVWAKAWGAKGDGSTDDTTAITNAYAVGKGVYFSPGNYIFNGPALSGDSNPTFVGEHKAVTTITVANGIYFVDDSIGWNTARVQGLTFTGTTPSGFFRSRYTGINVNGPKIFEDCKFQNHQVAAVSSNGSDEPYFKFVNDWFITSNVTTAIDVALAGQADSCEFISTAFNGARVNIKLRAAYTVKITDCDFIPFFSQSGGVRRARVWLVPSKTDGTAGAIIRGNKFGNEGIGSGDLHILIAGEQTGTWVGDMQPDLSTAQTNPIISLTVDNFFEGSATAAPPLVYSLTPNLYGCNIGGQYLGTYPTYAVQFASAPSAANRLADTTRIWLTTADTEGAQIGLTNAVCSYGHADDPVSLFGADPLTPQIGSADAGEVVDISPTTAPSWNVASATVTGTTDRLGGADAAEANITVNGGQVYAYITAPTIGAPAWVEFDLLTGSSSPLGSILFQVAQDTFQSGGAINLKRFINPPSGWQRYRFPLAFTTAGANIICSFQSPSATGKVRFGRVKVYHARSPLQIAPPKTQALTYSASITPAGLVPWQTITVTNTTAFTVNAPPNPSLAQPTSELTIEVLNSSGGTMGAITWNAAYVFPTGAWTNPASTKKRFARFEYNGSKWVCTSLATADY